MEMAEDAKGKHSAWISLKDKLRRAVCFSCCFRRPALDSPSSDDRPSLPRASSMWPMSRSHEPPPEIKYKCRRLINKIRRHSNRRKHSPSADFCYDPISYSLNFDDDALLRNLSTSAAMSPSPSPPKAVPE
ncbi:uncharacterized protein LOC127794647 [Diospyros lotus]|uniref:uncharacterized protein LOC127794647 n=1 Tax=Diospyros lotus TaxID=55363 RepID=UPI0022507712|nr:uncharacterized protein LOC127794647 [Diospyros lotus]